MNHLTSICFNLRSWSSKSNTLKRDWQRYWCYFAPLNSTNKVRVRMRLVAIFGRRSLHKRRNPQTQNFTDMKILRPLGLLFPVTMLLFNSLKGEKSIHEICSTSLYFYRTKTFIYDGNQSTLLEIIYPSTVKTDSNCNRSKTANICKKKPLWRRYNSGLTVRLFYASCRRQNPCTDL